MSDSAKGAARVGAAMTQLYKLGYRCMRASSSGQRKGSRKKEKLLAGDLIAFAPVDSSWPHIVAEVGGIGKRLRVAFDELKREGLPAGFVPIVVRTVERKTWWYSDPESRHANAQSALDALKAA